MSATSAARAARPELAGLHGKALEAAGERYAKEGAWCADALSVVVDGIFYKRTSSGYTSFGGNVRDVLAWMRQVFNNPNEIESDV